MRQLLLLVSFFIALTGMNAFGQMLTSPPAPDYNRSKFKESVGFHNTNKYVFFEDYNDVLEFGFDGSFTIEFWVKIPSSIQPGTLVLRTGNFDINFGMGVDANNNYTPGLLFLVKSYDPDPRWENNEDHMFPGTDYYYHLTAMDIPYFNDWFHVAIVRNRSTHFPGWDPDNTDAGFMRMYINGNASYQGYAPLDDLIPVENGLSMAQLYTSYLKIDELRIWGTARSASEIYTYMNEPIDHENEWLMAYYSFDGISPGSSSISNESRGWGSPGNDGSELAGFVYGTGPSPVFGTDRDYISEADGEWDDPDTWGGEVPGEDEIVVIDHSLTLTRDRAQHGLVFRGPDLAARMSGASAEKLVYTNGHTLTVQSPPSGGNESSYIVTNSDGKLIVENIPYTGAQIPVGTETSYRPVSISQPSGSRFVAFSLYARDEIAPAVTSAAAVVNASWDLTPLTPSQGTPPVYKIKFQWNTSDERDNFSRTSALVANYHNSAWSTLTSGSVQTTGGASYTLEADVTQFSPFIITSDQGSLPVRLAGFDIAREGSVAILKWSASEASDFSRFEIERSPDAKVWTTAGIERAPKQGSSMQHYTYYDPVPAGLSGRLYYRIKMVDLDDSYTYSPIRSIAWKASAPLGVYPNPAEKQSEIRLKFPGGFSNADLQIISLNGLEVYRRSGFSGEAVNLPDIPAGLYILSVKDDNGQVHREKFLIR